MSEEKSMTLALRNVFLHNKKIYACIIYLNQEVDTWIAGFLSCVVSKGLKLSNLEPVISISPEHISVIPKVAQIKYISVLPIRPIF